MILDIYDLALALKNCTRWSQSLCLSEESVLEHTAFVCMYAYKLCIKYDLNVEEVLEKALVHDMEEAYTGDIVMPTKYANNQVKNAIHDLERYYASKISDDVFKSDLPFLAWDNSKCIESSSGNAILVADAAAVVFKIKLEMSLGNKSFGKYICGVRRFLQDILDNPVNRFHTEVFDLIGDLHELEGEL